jgi:hypothetical protein
VPVRRDPALDRSFLEGWHMADDWFYAHDIDKLGPFTARQLKDLAATGEILTTDTIWREGVGTLATKI